MTLGRQQAHKDAWVEAFSQRTRPAGCLYITCFASNTALV
jgi:hypothetical protein